MTKVLALVGMGPGVSAAVARRFAREGFTIAAFARRADALAEQVNALKTAGGRAHGFTADAADPSKLSAAIVRAAGELGAFDALVYNAAGVRYKPLAQLTPDELDADLRVSVSGALAAAHAVLPSMRERGAGTLLFTGGGFAFEPMPALASLGVGKAALRNLTFALHGDLKDSGIHAATVTICGVVKPGTAFDPERIAESYWALHAQPVGSFERELMFKG
ncbi:MAG TPA: SDR family NAD(P)-dependent oxidoreductase [Caldimonas sp.]|nr:SDR family NAD(P)-dependent oxidoreductase [Caldimonas sp.]